MAQGATPTPANGTEDADSFAGWEINETDGYSTKVKTGGSALVQISRD